jgi:hypothetical protein
VVKSTNPFDARQTPQSKKRPADQPREYNGKPALTRSGIARRAARLVREGALERPGPRGRADAAGPGEPASAVEALAATQAQDRDAKAAARRRRSDASGRRPASPRPKTSAGKTRSATKTGRQGRAR